MAASASKSFSTKAEKRQMFEAAAKKQTQV
jgi:hypothetical protein